MTTLPSPGDDLVPASGGGDRFGFADHVGELILVTVVAVETGLITSADPRPTDAIRADVDVLDGPKAGDHYTNVLLFGKVVVNSLRGNVGKHVAGRVSQGVKLPGSSKSPAWILAEPTAAEMAKAAAFLAAPAGASRGANDTPPF